jgi:hypothetical protein
VGRDTFPAYLGDGYFGRWLNVASEANIPDGEIATAPVDGQVDGYISAPMSVDYTRVRRMRTLATLILHVRHR